MTNHSSTSVVTPDTGGETDYAEAQRIALRQQRKELTGKVKELRRQADGAKERARAAQARFERHIVLVASEKPDREDWYEYPGALPRKALLEAAGLSTVALHRIMERSRKAGAAKRNGKRR